MTTNRLTRRLTRVAVYVLGSLVILLASFHLWFVNHAEEIIEDLVNEQSNGKLHLKVKKFRFNWFSRKMELQQAVFYSTDTTTANTSYRFRVDRLKIQVKKILPVILDKKFYIDSIHVVNPQITVSKLRSSPTDTTAVSDTSLSIPQEMGRIYHSIQDALQVLKVDRFQIDNGTFSLVDKTRPKEKPIVISRLYFHLDNLQVLDSTGEHIEKKILFSDDVSLHTTNQDILFPDGRHRLSFSNFRINIRNRLAEFDSCTIIATKDDSANTSFRIFFDKLKMTDIDFDTLYHTEVIKADSVYCINPRFRLDVDLPKRTGPVQPPKLDELIQQLTGNMQLAFVIVQNGSFDINTMREGRPSSFTSNHNNFELQGLRIDQTAPRPLTVERFAMAIRNYENFLRDSAFAIQFDSILLNNNRISLNNFTYKELKNNKVANSLSMPQFELQGLSWDDLIFEQQLNAKQVTLIRPVINYDLSKRKGKVSKDVFNALSSVGSILQLNNLNIYDGKVNLFLDKNVSLHLEGATMAVSAKQLVDSRRLAAVQRSVNELDFKKGIIKTPNWTGEFSNVRFNGKKNELRAGTAKILDKKLKLDASDVTINSMVLPDKNQMASIKGITWQKANLELLSLPGSGTGSAGGFTLEDIRGANTNVTANTGDMKLSVQLKSIVADKVESRKGEPLLLTGFSANGNDLSVTGKDLQVKISDLDFNDKRPSVLKNVFYSNHSVTDSVLLRVPLLTLTPDINAILKGHINADAVKISQPYIKINLGSTVSLPSEQVSAKKKGIQDLQLGSIIVQQPVISYSSSNEKGSTLLEWEGKTNGNTLEVTNLQVQKTNPYNISADQLRFSMDHFQYINPKGRKFDAGEGQIVAQINKLEFSKNETDTWDWQGLVQNLTAKNFIIDSIGKKDATLTITSAKINDLSISSSLLLDMRELVKKNNRFNLKEVTGSYHDEENQFNWFNAGYDKTTKRFDVDSFTYRPTYERDEFLKKKVYQTDYMSAHTGAISIGPFDVERYSRDTILDLGVITVKDGYLASYRDKRMPRQTEVVKSLPATMLKKISTKLIADTVNILNSYVDYQEVNEKTGATGKITISRMNGNITHLRNFDLGNTDSLTIRTSGYLQDTMFAKLQLRESYTDTLGGFLLTGQMGPADITKLNPVLVSLASAELRSGILDTMSMRVVGREYLAFGEMKMYYHNLKVRITKPGNKRTLMTSLTTFLANTLIKNENKNRTGTIFFVRWRDRSPINYLVKIALSGMTSSMGIKRNKKLIRKYEKEIKARNLPPVVL